MTLASNQISMKEPVWRRRVRRHLGKTLVEADRRPEIEEKITGFVLGLSDDLILFHLFDWNTFSLDGYVIIRLNDIELFRAYSRIGLWQKRAVEMLKIRPRTVCIGLSNWEEAISDIAKQYPLVHVQRELKYPRECWIGFPLEVTSKQLTLENLDPKAGWTGPYSMSTSDITRVGFGGGYERALAMTAPRRPKRNQRRS
jgi:hypothetical protein